MLGAILGSIVGPLLHPRARFTDDTVLTIAVAK